MSHTAAIRAMRSLSLTRISPIPRMTVAPSAKAAVAARTGYSSIIEAARSGGTTTSQQWQFDALGNWTTVTTNGVAIHLPTTGDGRHADYASALAMLAAEHLHDVEADRAADGFDDGEREMMAEQDQDRRDEQRLGWM